MKNVARSRDGKTLRPLTLLGGLSVLMLLLGAAPAVAAPCPDEPEDELCNGIDDDCDGEIDEGFGVGEACEVGSPPGCMPGDPDGCCLVPGIRVCASPTTTECDVTSVSCIGGVCCVAGNCDRFDPPVPCASDADCPSPPPVLERLEGPGGDPTCFDGIDNDCDELVDHADPECQTAEVCNGFDDDNNGVVDDTFPGLGEACTAGEGGCARAGTVICNEAGDGTRCSAVGLEAEREGPPRSQSCSDVTDNDCDGLVDLADPDCQSAERCDGKDNDGDGVIDNGFPGLGDPCTVGVGVCERAGVTICSRDRTATVCSVAPGVPTPEGPAGVTCRDGLDNDCDGLTDLDDPSCGSAQLQVSCALPLRPPLPRRASDCNAWHEVVFEASGAGPETVVTAELLALDAEGGTLGSTPVNSGDRAFLHSSDRKVKVQSIDGKHHITAPLPVLRVVADDGLNRAEAYCSPVPFVKAVAPSCCGITSEAAGNITPVTVAIPGIDPRSLVLRIDGVDILAALSIDPAQDFPGGPFGGTALINGKTVAISDLVVSTASNTLTMKVTNLPCGGHVTVVQGEPLPDALPKGPPHCHVDDYHDKCVTSVFGIEIDSPMPQEVTMAVPTPVRGRVCHGRQIRTLRLNGLRQDTSGQARVPGDGTTSADTWVLPIDTALEQTNLRRATLGDFRLGTLDRGSNRLVADAEDEFGNRTFKSVVFAVGPVAQPGIATAAAVRRLEEGVRADLLGTMEDTLREASTAISNAFVLGLTDEAIDTIIDEKCEQKWMTVRPTLESLGDQVCRPAVAPLNGADCGTPEGLGRCTAAGGVCSPLMCHAKGTDAHESPCTTEEEVRACNGAGGVCAQLCSPPAGSVLDGGPCGSCGQIRACEAAGGSCPATTKDVGIWCSCDPCAIIRTTSVELVDPEDRIRCSAELLDGRMVFGVAVPDLRIGISVSGSCDGFLCGDASVSYSGTSVVSGMKAEMQVTEELFEGTAPPIALCGNGTLDPGEFCDPSAAPNGCPDPSAACSPTCSVCSTPPNVSEPEPPVEDNTDVDAGCWCTVLAVLLVIATAILAAVTGGALAGLIGLAFVAIGIGIGAVGGVALAVILILPAVFQPDIPALPPSEAEAPKPLSLDEIEPVSALLEQFNTRLTSEIEDVEITPAGLTASLKGTFELLTTDPGMPEVAASLTAAPATSTPLPDPNAGNTYFVMADDTFNLLFYGRSVSGELNTPFQVDKRKLCSISNAPCQTDDDCTAGADDTCVEVDLTLGTLLVGAAAPELPGIGTNTLLLVRGRPDMPLQLLVDDDPMRCSTSEQLCESGDDCPAGELCAPTVTPDEVEVRVRANDFFIEMIADRPGAGVFPGPDGDPASAPGCFTPPLTTRGDCSVLALCLDLSIDAVVFPGPCTGDDGSEQTEIRTQVKALTVRPAMRCANHRNVPCEDADDCPDEGEACTPLGEGEVCGSLVLSTPQALYDLMVSSGFDTKTVDVFQDTLNDPARGLPPACINGLGTVGGLGSFVNPRPIAVNVPGGDPEGFDDYLGITGDILPVP